jgi:SAM-dependent MidA family methyltransferase
VKNFPGRVRIVFMNALAEIIREEIAQAGSIRFDRFMELALYHPDHGYYRRERVRTGRAGDFFTSVSVGPLFGRLLARQFLEMWDLLGRPAPFWIVEQGAEDAQLAVDMLDWGREKAEPFFEAIRYGLVEGWADRRAVQRERLEAAGLAGRVSWFQDFHGLAREKPEGVFVSNELADVFPVRRVVFRRGEWRELGVGVDAAGAFDWRENPIDEEDLASATEALPRIEGYATEINLQARAWMEEVGGALRRGYVVTLDYGFAASDYYADFRRDGTLTAYRDHRRSADILLEPGSQDITAHVDFTALARAGVMAGLTALGFLDQQRFLTGIAHDELEGRAGPGSGIQENLRAWQTLTHPDHLGSRFRALVQGKEAPGGLAGLRYARPGGLD